MRTCNPLSLDGDRVLMIGCFRVGCCGHICWRGSEPDLGFK
eukprot:gene26531-biopygen16772